MTHFCYLCRQHGRQPVELPHPGICDACGRDEKRREHDRTLAAAYRSIPPSYRWPRLDSPLMAERVANWSEVSGHVPLMLKPRSVVLCGETGVGKTALATALMYALLDAASLAYEFPKSSAELVNMAQQARFIPVADLATPENRHLRLAAERSPWAIFDDAGQEIGADSFQGRERGALTKDILDRRFRAGLRTVITTYGSEIQWEQWYGGGIVRRYREMPDCFVYQMKSR